MPTNPYVTTSLDTDAILSTSPESGNYTVIVTNESGTASSFVIDYNEWLRAISRGWFIDGTKTAPKKKLAYKIFSWDD